MCGITGFVGKNIDLNKLDKATSLLNHRGPDYSSISFFGQHNKMDIGLGHQRLKIIDLSDNANQPMSNIDGSLHIVYNGEIYNYKELKLELSLKEKPHRFKTNSDTEVILHAYEEWGEECVKKFNGIFAFVIYDKEKELLLLARDRAGIKPLYIYSDKENFMFASEIKALFELGAKKELNKEILKDFFNYQISINEETLFKDIFAFPHGYYGILKIKEGIITMKQYWCPEYQSKERSPAELKELLTATIRRQMISDVPVGTFLSGGLDSSIITALAVSEYNKRSKTELNSQQTKPVSRERLGVDSTRSDKDKPADTPFKTFTAGFEGYEEEIKNAEAASKSFGTEHHSILITPRMFIEALPRLIYQYDQPISFASSVALYYVSKLASDNGVKVILTGEGADELFAGYSRYKRIKDILLINKGQGLAFGDIDFYIAKLLFKDPRYIKNLDLIFRKNNYDYLTGINAILPDNNKNHPLRRCVKKLFETGCGGIGQANEDEILNGLLYLDWHTYLQELLTKQDRMSMAVSIESRVPFLDNEVIDFANSLPPTLKLFEKQGKHILRQAVKDILPKEIIERKKIGFTVPLDQWFRGPLYHYICDILNDKIVFKYFGQDYVLDMMHKQKKQNCSLQLWAMLNFKIWYAIFFEGISPNSSKLTYSNF